MAWLPFGSVTPEALCERGWSLLASGQLDEALAASNEAFRKLEELVQRGKAVDGVLLRRLFLLKGIASSRSGSHRSALECLIRAGQAIWAEPAAPLAAVTSGAALEDVSPEAVEIYIQCLSRPGGATARHEPDKMISLIEGLMRPEPRRRNDFAVLKDLNSKVIAVAPQLAWPHLHIAMIEALEGKFDHVLPALDRALAIDSGGQKARLLAAFVHVRAGRFIDAKAALGAIDPRDTNMERLLLNAAIERGLGNFEAALSCFQRARVQGPLPLESQLAWIEVLASTGAIGEARVELGRLAQSDDLRVQILRNAVDAMTADDPGAPLDALAALLADRAAADGAARAVQWLAAVRPEDDRIANLVERLPASSRKARSEAARAIIQAQNGRIADALQTWDVAASAGEPMPVELRRAVVAAMCQSYNSGDFLGTIDIATRLTADHALALEAAPVVLVSVAGAIEAGSLRDMPPEYMAGQLWRIARSCMEFWQCGSQAHVLALAFCVCDAPEKACFLLSSNAAVPAEVMVQLRAAELRAGDASRQPLVPEREDARHIMLAAIAAALRGDFASAMDWARRLDPSPDGAGLLATLYAAHGRWNDVESVPPLSSTVVLCHAVAHDLRGDEAGVASRLAAIPDGDRARRRANELRAAQIIRKARLALSGGKGDAADRDAMVQAIRLAPGRNGPLGRCMAHPGAAHLALIAGDYESFAAVVETVGDGPALEDMATAHNLALFQLVALRRATVEGETSAAVGHFESAIAHLALVLAHTDYLAEWTEHRIETYSVDGSMVDLDELEQSILTMFAGMCLAAFAMPGKRSNGARGLATPVDGSTFVDILTRSELAAARLVAEHEDLSWLKSDLSSAVGPLLLASSGFGPVLAEFCDELDFDPSTIGGADPARSDALTEVPATELDDLLDRLGGRDTDGGDLEDNIADPSEPSRPFRVAFSSLRLAATALDLRQPELAAKLLRSPLPSCAAAVAGACRQGPTSGCRDASEAVFRRCNPGFQGNAGADGLARAAADLECTILLAISEQKIMSARLQVADVEALWREALEAGSRCGQVPRVRTEVRRMALGRAKSLDAEGRADESRDLLYAAAAVVDDDVLRGHLSAVEASAGITAANESGDFHGAVEKLRRALQLNPHSTHARKNLLVAIQVHAQSLCRRSMPEAIRLLEDGSRIAHAWLREDPRNKELLETIEVLDDYLGLLRAAAPGSVQQTAPAALPREQKPPSQSGSEGSSEGAKSDLDSLLEAARKRREAATKQSSGT